MCAINGFTWTDRELLLRMNEAVAHRGPDGTGTHFELSISLGHNRLAIIDPRTLANQPMKSASGRFIITYNGELYNFKELKEELAGYQFSTSSDTEVILAAWERWGAECLPKFNGIFAFAIWDTLKQRLSVARDESGVKPLYYHVHNGRLIFSSEIKAILEHPIARVLDPDAFSHYTRLLFVPGPHTLFKGIFKLPPGHLLTWTSQSGVSIQPFSGRETEKRYFGSYDEAKENLRVTLEASAKQQLISDKPLGIYLSGGFDSSIILASVVSSRDVIDTFSVGFSLSEEEDERKFNADFNLARKTARHFKTRHHEVMVNSDDVVDYLSRALFHLDEPIANATVIPQLVLAQYAKSHVDVVLSGDGGDELFGGYERYRLSLLASYYSRLPHGIRTRLDSFEKCRKLNTPPGISRYMLFLSQKDAILQSVLQNGVNDRTGVFLQSSFFSDTDQHTSFEDHFMDVDRKTWLVDESLLRTDKLSMAHGLEVRVPFLDTSVLDTALSLPRSYKVTPFSTKRILRDAFRGHIPDFLYRQPKRGWFSPGAKWLRHEKVHTFAKEVLTPSYYTPTTPLFSWNDIARILEDHCAHRKYNLTVLWMLISFQIWAQRYDVTIE